MLCHNRGIAREPKGHRHDRVHLGCSGAGDRTQLDQPSVRDVRGLPTTSAGSGLLESLIADPRPGGLQGSESAFDDGECSVSRSR
jgi:hypothetical protein